MWWNTLSKAFEQFRKWSAFKALLELTGVWKWIALGFSVVSAFLLAFFSKLDPLVRALIVLLIIALALAIVLFLAALRWVGENATNAPGNEQSVPAKPEKHQLAIVGVLALLAVVGAVWPRKATDTAKRSSAPAQAGSVAQQGTVQTAAGGMIFNGGTVVAPTINNYSPASRRNVTDSLIVGTLKPDNKASGPIFEEFMQHCERQSSAIIPKELQDRLPRVPPDFLKRGAEQFRKNLSSTIPTDALRVYLGNANLGFTSKPSQVVLRAADTDLLAIRRTEGGMSVDAKLLSKDVILDIVNNEFHINGNNEIYWRYNHVPQEASRHSLVVYDKQAREVLNIQYLNRRTVRILGTFRYSDRLAFVVSENKMTMAEGASAMVCSVSGDNEGALFHVQ